MSIQPLVDHYRNTEVGHHLQRLGREEGLERGRREEKETMLLALLHSRFGGNPGAQKVVQRLAAWTESAAIDAILCAPDLETLLTAEPPS